MPFDIRNAHGERLDHTHVPGRDGATDVVVVGHGVTANKDRPFLTALADALAARNIASLRFSFAGNGNSEGRFEESTISKEVDDLGAVIDALEGRRILYVGHSMGAAVGVLRASRDPRIRALVSLAGMVHTADFVQRKFGEQEPGASLMWDKPECPLSQAFVDDLTAIDSVVAQAARIEVPWLLVHGDADSVVPLRDAADVRAAAQGRPELVTLPGVDHVFSSAGTSAMTEPVVRFIERVIAS